MEWQEGELDANGVRIHYYRRGVGRALVLAHGMTDNGKCWSRLATVLEDRFDIVAYDARYHGLSEAPAAGGFGGGEDLVAVVTALGLEKPALLGHSMGAATVAQAAGLRPELFSCVILEDPPWRDDWSAIRQQPQTPAPDWRALSIEQIVAAGRAQSPLWHPDEFPAWAESKRQFRGPADWRARAIPGIVDWRETVAAIGVPALLLRGGSSERGAIVSAEIAAEAQRLNSRVQTACFAQAGHNVRREAFAPYAAAVSSFLARY